MKVLFVEPINVLNSKAHRRRLLELNDFRNYDNFIEREFEPEKVKLLKNILEQTDAKMVLYTKERCCSQKIGALLHKLTKYGLSESSWLDTIPNVGEQYPALVQWLNSRLHFNVTKYAILDNIINGVTPEDAHNLFWADKNDGLTEDISEKIINHLNS